MPFNPSKKSEEDASPERLGRNGRAPSLPSGSGPLKSEDEAQPERKRGGKPNIAEGGGGSKPAPRD